MKSSFKSKAFCLVFVLGLLVLAPECFSLLQGNRLLPLKDPNGAGTAGPLEIAFELDENANDTDRWLTLGKKDPAKKTIEPFNLSEMSYLSFWVKIEGLALAQAVNLFVEIREDTDSNQRFVFGQDLASRAAAARFTGAAEEKNWRRVTIPFSQFRELRHWDRILEMGFIVQIKRGQAKGKLFVDRLQVGSHYPEGTHGKEIRMQNRVSSFKIGNRVANPGMTLKPGPTPLTLTMSFIDPYLEEIRFEESGDGGRSWKALQSFYDHQQGGVYKMIRKPDRGKSVEFQVVGVSVSGGESELAGPYRVDFS